MQKPAMRTLGIRHRDIEKLVQPRGAVDGDCLPRQLALVNLGGLDDLVKSRVKPVKNLS